MNLTMFRETSTEGATLSRMLEGGDFLCDVLEDVVREVPGESVESWKVFGVTAIPSGTYRITFETSNRFGPNTLTVNDVDGFSGVRCHAGNYAKDTEGCLLFGERDSDCTVTHSRVTLEKMKNRIKDAMGMGEEIWLEIVPA